MPRCADAARTLHPPLHPFLEGHDAAARSDAIAYVAFQMRAPQTGGNFVDYTTRYGAIRTEDSMTLLENILESVGVYVGTVAARRFVPDPFADDPAVGRFKWRSDAESAEARRRADAAMDAVNRFAPRLHMEPLLQRPLVALSNGQSRRARIFQALVSGAQLLVLDEPFTGLDPPTRAEVADLLAELHAARAPRVVLILRDQDVVPSFITHTLRVDDDGNVALGHTDTGNDARLGGTGGASGDVGKQELSGDREALIGAAAAAQAPTEGARGIDRAHAASKPASAPASGTAAGGYDRVRANFAVGVGAGDAASAPYVQLESASLSYGGIPVLRDVSLRVLPGSRTVIVGDNGSGKTTLLSLLLGDNPRAFAMPASQLRMWGAARDAPQNAHALLQRRIGHLSPELFNAFPRRGAGTSGLSVFDAVASGFDGIFTPRAQSAERAARVFTLLRQCAEVIVGKGAAAMARGTAGSAFANVAALADAPFVDLSHGSQVLVLLLRALVHRPSLLVLDEPFQGMSSRQATCARALLDGGVGGNSEAEEHCLAHMDADERARELAWRSKLAIVFISHYESEWLRSCGHLLRLRAGEVVEKW
ncbi:hypothetical protein MSPP1_003638 [Malassezia sp. CBS 17886]|nr:hypothetical protein MSPP1_003638 [Malassezia sp. CBS 17886]